MNEKKFICKRCGNTEYIVKEKPNGTGVATGLYCAKCGTWQKWLNKQEKVLYNSELVGKQDDEQELREKIIKVLERGALSFHEYFNAQMKNAFENGAKHYSNKDCDKSIYDFWADELIAAGMGDVKEAEHRAARAEKALKRAVNVYIAHTETSSKKKWWYKYFLREAEKELAEEGKDD